MALEIKFDRFPFFVQFFYISVKVRLLKVLVAPIRNANDRKMLQVFFSAYNDDNTMTMQYYYKHETMTKLLCHKITSDVFTMTDDIKFNK